MSEPEIARRCQACGASIRDHAAFCPQCGKKLNTAAADTAPLEAADVTSEEPKVDRPSARGAAPSPSPTANPRLSQPKQSSQSPNPGNKKTAGAPGGHLVAEARGKVQRATGMAKHVGGDVVQRGQKLREMSSVVLDEASYDPSLRFVLVAAVLFFLFLIIVLLNRFIV